MEDHSCSLTHSLTLANTLTHSLTHSLTQTLTHALQANGGSLTLPMIMNKKTVNPRDSKSTPVFQLETAMGSAIECFDDAGAIVVPRSRFAPVKTCGDLFLLRSDAYAIQPDFTIKATVDKVPMIKLDDAHYKLVDKMEALVESYPSMVKASSLTVKGAVKFMPGVTIKGDVTLEAEDGPAEVGNVTLDGVTKKLSKVSGSAVFHDAEGYIWQTLMRRMLSSNASLLVCA
jgi:UTP--glucose-1-phosphate uridylyltransferase